MSSLFPELSQPDPSAASARTRGWVNAHCDGGARGNPGPAGYGAVLVDDQGNTLAELSEFLGVRTNNVAEYAGLLAVLRWTSKHGYTRVRVTSDSLLMVKQMKGQYKVNSPDLRPMWEEARRLARALEAFEITHALRHKNKVADRLANEAMDRGMGRGAREAASPSSSSARPVSAPRPALKADEGTQAGANEPEGSGPIRGLVRDGVVRLLGGRTLAEGTYVRVTQE